MLTGRISAVILLAALALITFAGTVLDQVPDELRGDPVGYSAWLGTVRGRYGPLTDLMARLQFFELFHSAWLVVVSTLLALSTSASVLTRGPQIWRRARKARADAGGADDKAGLSSRLWWTPLGTLVGHVGMVLVLLGVAVTALLGFRDDDVRVTVGQPFQLGHNSGLTLLAHDIDDSVANSTVQAGARSALVVRRGNIELGSGWVQANEPLRAGGVSVHQVGRGTSAMISVRDRSGRTVFAAAVPLRWSAAGGARVVGRVRLSAEHATLDVAAPGSGRTDKRLAAGQIQAQLYPDGARLPRQAVLDPGSTATVGGLIVTYGGEAPHTVVVVKRDPGRYLVWCGAVLLVVGMGLTLMRPRRDEP